VFAVCRLQRKMLHNFGIFSFSKFGMEVFQKFRTSKNSISGFGDKDEIFGSWGLV
jgi:hypothetical protein